MSAVTCIEILISCLLYGTSACLRSFLSAAQARLYGICNEITHGNAQVDSHLATLQAPRIDFLRDEQV